jgi:hypothetical protein
MPVAERGVAGRRRRSTSQSSVATSTATAHVTAASPRQGQIGISLGRNNILVLGNPMANPYLAHASSRYHTSYGETPLTRAFLATPNLAAMVTSFDARLSALYTDHGLPAPHLVIDESWVLELFDYLHRTRHHHRSVAEANAGFEHQFFKSLTAAVYDKTRHTQTLAGKAGIPAYCRRYYSTESVKSPQLATKVVHGEAPIMGSRNHAAGDTTLFAPNPAISQYARGI